MTLVNYLGHRVDMGQWGRFVVQEVVNEVVQVLY